MNMFFELEVHKATISVAIAKDERGGEVRHWGTVPHWPDHLRKLVEKLGAHGFWLHFCYEAGPYSYACTALRRDGSRLHHGGALAHSGKGESRVKLHRAGELTSVWVRGAAHEAMPDLVRARVTAMRVLGQPPVQSLVIVLLAIVRNRPVVTAVDQAASA